MKGQLEVRGMDAPDPGWDEYVLAGSAGTFFHLSGWLRVVGKTFPYRSHSFVATRDGAIVGILPLFLVPNLPYGRSLVSTPFGVYGGICADDDDVAAALLSHAQAAGERLGVRYVEYRHEKPVGNLPVKDLYVTFRRPIYPTADENMAAIPRNQRRSIRVGIKHGLSSKVGDFDLLSDFYEVYSQSVRNHGTPVFPRALFENLLGEFGPRCWILGVYHEGRMVAGVLTFLFRDQVMPYYGGAVKAAFPLGANDFMYWSLMDHGMSLGHKVFDFGRSKKDSGSYHFKRHWGFTPTPLHYQFSLVRQRAIPDLTPRNPRFAWAIRAWRRMPLRVTQWIGPKVIHFFP